MVDLTTPESRAKLTPRATPYFQKVSPGRYLGFRRGPNTWLAREQRSREAKRKFHAIGPEAEHDYHAALAKAVEWFQRREDDDVVSSSKMTLAVSFGKLPLIDVHVFPSSSVAKI